MEENKNTFPTLMEILLNSTTVSKKWYRNEELIIDGYSFTECRFDNCKLYFRTNDFKLINCFIDENTIIYPIENNVNVLRAFHVKIPKFDALWKFYAPIRNNDGTITVNYVENEK